MCTNMGRVDAGELTNSEASMAEGKGFLKDVANSNFSGKDRLASLAGVVANMGFGPAFHYPTDQYNYLRNKGQSPEVRAMMHAHTSGDTFS